MKWAETKTSKGFTIVELLIVVVVIAILAAITIVAYNGITANAHVSTVKSDFANVAKKAEMYKVNSTTSVFPASATDLVNAEVVFSKGSYTSLIWCHNNANGVWSIVGTAKDGKSYYLNSTTKTFTEYSGSVAGVSGGTTCPLVGVNSAGWTWILQTANGAWAY